MLPFLSLFAMFDNNESSKNQNDSYMTKNNEHKASSCGSGCQEQEEHGSVQLSCQLTSVELQKRKTTVLANLKEKMLSKEEIENGYVFKFSGSDELLDELIEFVKTERTCCNFFKFNLSISGDKSETWLELTGPKGAKQFIVTELGF